MTDLKLANWPDRTPGKLTLGMTLALGRARNDCVAACEQEDAASLPTPGKLAQFLENDREFARRCGDRLDE